MLSAVNSVKFVNVNNYKRTYTNTNQSVVGYQQSFGASRPSKTLSLIGGILMVFGVSCEKGAGKAVDAAAKVAKPNLNSERNIYSLLERLKGKALTSSDPTGEGGLILNFGKDGKEGSIITNPSEVTITLPNEAGCSTTFITPGASVKVQHIIPETNVNGNCIPGRVQSLY